MVLSPTQAMESGQSQRRIPGDDGEPIQTVVGSVGAKGVPGFVVDLPEQVTGGHPGKIHLKPDRMGPGRNNARSRHRLGRILRRQCEERVTVQGGGKGYGHLKARLRRAGLERVVLAGIILEHVLRRRQGTPARDRVRGQHRKIPGLVGRQIDKVGKVRNGRRGEHKNRNAGKSPQHHLNAFLCHPGWGQESRRV